MDNGEEYLFLSIPKILLKKGNYYAGFCQNNSRIAKWNGDRFYYWKVKFGKTYLEDLDYWELNGIYNGFIPLFDIGSELPKEILI
jgi:hypothetical protein